MSGPDPDPGPGADQRDHRSPSQGPCGSRHLWAAAGQPVEGHGHHVSDPAQGGRDVLGPSSSPTSVSTVSQIRGEEIPHIKVGPKEMSHLQYLRFVSGSLYPNNKDWPSPRSPSFSTTLQPASSSSAHLKAECLLRLEELVCGFLISKETLSMRMLDDSWDPTPLLKEFHNDESVYHPH